MSRSHTHSLSFQERLALQPRLIFTLSFIGLLGLLLWLSGGLWRHSLAKLQAATRVASAQSAWPGEKAVHHPTEQAL